MRGADHLCEGIYHTMDCYLDEQENEIIALSKLIEDEGYQIDEHVSCKKDKQKNLIFVSGI